MLNQVSVGYWIKLNIQDYKKGIYYPAFLLYIYVIDSHKTVISKRLHLHEKVQCLKPNLSFREITFNS